jgi:hypothetical protein
VCARMSQEDLSTILALKGLLMYSKEVSKCTDFSVAADQLHAPMRDFQRMMMRTACDNKHYNHPDCKTSRVKERLQRKLASLNKN